MKTQPTSRPGYHRANLSSVTRIATLVALVALIGIPLFSSSSASSLNRAWKTGNPMAAPAMGSGRAGSSRADLNEELVFAPEQVFSTHVGRTISFPLLVPQAGTPSVATFDGTDGTTCSPGKTEFSLGQNVCATATNTGGATANRRFSWADPQGFVRQQTSITSDPQNDHFDIPSTPTSTLSNGQVVSNIGNWRVNIISSRGALVTYATFVVKDPANATADLAVFKRAPTNSEQVQAGSNGSFNITAQNSGPDDAATVTLTDHVPANTTFVTMVQTSGQPNSTFTCDTVPNGLGNITCTITTFAAGASATFDFVYTVNAGTPAGTLITNTVSIASATTNELNNSDNSASASASVTSGGGTGTCTINCPEDIVTQSNTTDPNDPNQPGAIVHFDAPTTDGACGTVTIDHCNDCFFPQGNTVVTARATTGDSCSFSVTVTAASNAPTISCPPNKEVDAHGDCQAQVDVGTATATGGQNVTIFGTRSDGKPLYTCDANGQNCVRVNPDFPFAGGVTTITWTATSHDAQGAEIGSSSCTQTITVDNASDDTTPPVITCPANITRSTDPGQCSATINVGTATATDHCDSSPEVVGTRSDNQPLSAPYPKGTTTITWTATDSSGNQSSCSQTITVNDTEPPAITCPANISTSTEPGTCSAHVATGTATATDNCGSTTVTGTRSDGRPLTDTYPKGTTTITWTATDSSGNQSSCAQTVTVVDNQAPTITFNGQTPSMWPPNHNYRTFTAADFISSVSDNCDALTVNDVYITKATSDEAVNAPGSGTTANDIVIASNCKSVQLRAERIQSGNGRVYTIYFKLRDSSGNFTTGTAKVYSPKNLGETPVDDGPHYTVTSSCP